MDYPTLALQDMVLEEIQTDVTCDAMSLGISAGTCLSLSLFSHHYLRANGMDDRFATHCADRITHTRERMLVGAGIAQHELACGAPALG